MTVLKASIMGILLALDSSLEIVTGLKINEGL